MALTGDDLDDSCFLHVGWKVASSHVLLHDPDVGQLLQKAHRRVSSQGQEWGHSAPPGLSSDFIG